MKIKIKIFISVFLLFFLPFISLVNLAKDENVIGGETEVSGEDCYSSKKLQKEPEQLDTNSKSQEDYQKNKSFCILYLKNKEKNFFFIKESFLNLFLLLDVKEKLLPLSNGKSLKLSSLGNIFSKIQEKDESEKIKLFLNKTWSELKDNEAIPKNELQEIEFFFTLFNKSENEQGDFLLVEKFKNIFFEKWKYFFKKVVDFAKLKISNELYYKEKWFTLSLLEKKTFFKTDFSKKGEWNEILDEFLEWEKLKTVIKPQQISFFLSFLPSFKEKVSLEDFERAVNEIFNGTLEKLLGEKFTIWKQTFNSKKENIKETKDKNGYKLVIHSEDDFLPQSFYFKNENQFKNIISKKKINDINFETLIEEKSDFVEKLLKFEIRNKDEGEKLKKYEPKISLKIEKIKKTINKIKIQNKSKKEDNETLKNIFIILGVAVFSLLMIVILFKIFNRIKIKQEITVFEKSYGFKNDK